MKISSKKGIYFLTLHFDKTCCSLKLLVDEEENSQKIRENVVVDKKEVLT